MKFYITTLAKILLILSWTLLVPKSSIFGQKKERSLEQDPLLNNLVHPDGYVTMDTTKLGNVVKRGSGPRDLILIAGLGLSGEFVFKEFIENNKSKYTMYVVTLAGYGGTQAYPMPAKGTSYGARTWLTYGQHGILNLIDKHQLVAPVLVSYSTEGHIIAMQIAKDDPDKIGGIVSIGAEPFRRMVYNGNDFGSTLRTTKVDKGWAPKWFKMVTKKTWDSNMYADEAYSLTPGLGNQLASKINEPDLQVMVRYLCEQWTFDPRPTYSEINTPILAIVPGFTAEFLADPENQLYKNSFVESWTKDGGDKIYKSHVIERAGLFVYHDQPEKVDKLIYNFIKELE
ncbi:MAG: alpha/beta hydrolase [Bacteroidota bacterium]